MGKVKRLTVKTHDGQTHVFASDDAGEMDQVKRTIGRVVRGVDMCARLVNENGKTVTVWSISIKSVR